MLIVGYCFGVRSERRLCEEVHPNLAYRSVAWASTARFPIIRPSRRIDMAVFARSDLLRKLFETVVARCMKERLVGG